MPRILAGRACAPSGARPLWHGACPHGGNEELFACLRKFKHLEAKRCPVPFQYAAVFALTALPRMWQDSTILGQLPGLRGLVSVPTRRCPKANSPEGRRSGLISCEQGTGMRDIKEVVSIG